MFFIVQIFEFLAQVLNTGKHLILKQLLHSGVLSFPPLQYWKQFCTEQVALSTKQAEHPSLIDNAREMQEVARDG
jgi:hypothetical protein